MTTKKVNTKNNKWIKIIAISLAILLIIGLSALYFTNKYISDNSSGTVKCPGCYVEGFDFNNESPDHKYLLLSEKKGTSIDSAYLAIYAFDKTSSSENIREQQINASIYLGAFPRTDNRLAIRWDDTKDYVWVYTEKPDNAPSIYFFAQFGPQNSRSMYKFESNKITQFIEDPETHLSSIKDVTQDLKQAGKLPCPPKDILSLQPSDQTYFKCID